MDVAEFEQDILKLAFETDVRITTASVSYYLGIPSTKAGPLLEELLERGVLELDSDPEGNLYYRVTEAIGEDAEISRLKQERDAGVDGGTETSTKPHETEQQTGALTDRIGEARVDEIEEGEPFSPQTVDGDNGGRPDSRSDSRSNAETRGEREATGSVGRQSFFVEDSDRESDTRRTERRDRRNREQKRLRRRDRERSRRRDKPDGSSTPGVVSTKSEDPFAGVTRKRAAMDASLDSCGGDNVVVQSEASCDPSPLADSSPVLASCSENPPTRSNQMIRRQEDYTAIGNLREPRPAGASQGQGATAIAYRREDHLEKPEHQPGMSLLLSLILCGTGQIYNGEVSKGIMMMVLCFLLWFVLLGWVVHIWSIVDSVVVAERINRQSGNN